MRGIAAISIALLHFNIGSHFNNAFVSNAWLAVDFFFVLSGFVIALNYIEKISSFEDLLAFQKKRFLRLYPLHILMLFVFLGIEFAKLIAEIKFGEVANNQAFTEYNLISFLANVFLVQNWAVSFNFPSWSISVEFFTYAIFAMTVLIFGQSRKTHSIILLLAALFFSLILYNNGFEDENFNSLVRCLYSFSIGVLVFNLYDYFKEKINLTSSLPALFLLFISIFLVARFGNRGFDYLILIPIAFGITILILVLTNQGSAVNRYLSNRWLVYLGTISYGIYMIHVAIWWMIRQLLRFQFNFPTAKEGIYTKIVIENVFLADAITISGLILILILAHLSYQFVEKRFYKIRN